MRLLNLLVFYEGVFNSVVNGAFIRDADIRHVRLAYSMATYTRVRCYGLVILAV